MKYQAEELGKMKRAELQKLCKSYGIKANMKTTKLIEALLQVPNRENSMKPVENKAEGDVNSARSAIKTAVEAEESKKDKREPTLSQSAGMQEIREDTGKRVVEVNILPSKGPSKIPHLNHRSKSNKNVGYSTPKNAETKTPKRTTGSKDWSKIHQIQFDKMDSLSDYLDKKRKRADELTNSYKKLKLSQKGDESTTKKSKEAQNPPVRCPSIITPKVNSDGRKKRLTFNFTKTKENVITPAQVKRRATLGDTKPTTQAVNQKPVTPFRFSAAPNTATLFSPTPRKVFDLKASLAKPLTYKPYTGRLPIPPYVKQNAKVALVKKVKTHEHDVKGVKVTSRKERVEQQMKNRAKKKADALCKRRGVIC